MRLTPDMHLNSKFFKSCIRYHFGRRLGDTFSWHDPMNKRHMSSVLDLIEFNLCRGWVDSYPIVTNLKGRDEPPKGWGKS